MKTLYLHLQGFFIMKQILIIILLLLLSMLAYGQDYYTSIYVPEKNVFKKNTLYLAVQPTDLGVGVRYDRMLFNKIYTYSSLTYGNYKMRDGSYIDDHVKFSLGALLTTRFIYPEVFFSGGVNYHHYGEYFFTNGYTDKNTLMPISFEIGLGTKLNNMVVGFRMDIPKWESSLDFGINF